MKVGVVGPGNSGHALSAYLSSQGHEVTIFARDLGKVAELSKRREISARGKLEGVFPIAGVVDDAKSFASASEVIFVTTVATAYRDIARLLAPHLTSKHKVILFSGKLCGSLEFEQAIKSSGGGPVDILETDALFACRNEEPCSIWIRGFKQWTLYSGTSRSKTKELGDLIRGFFPKLEPANNLIQRGLTDFGALAHAVITLANLSRIDRADPFLFYYEGLSEKTVRLLDESEREFRAVAQAYGTSLIPMKDLLNRYYGCDTTSLLTALTTVPNYGHSWAPTTLQHRYLSEDVMCSLVPMQGLARKAGVRTPMTDSVISIMSILAESDFTLTGRTLDRLGLNDHSADQIRESWAS